MAPQFNPPSFVQPKDYSGISNLGNSIDSIFNAYMQAKQLGRDLRRQNATDFMQYGVPLSQISQQQLMAAQQPAQVAPQPGQGQGMYANPGQTLSSGDPVVDQLRNLRTMQQNSAMLGAKEAQSKYDLGQTELQQKQLSNGFFQKILGQNTGNSPYGQGTGQATAGNNPFPTINTNGVQQLVLPDEKNVFKLQELPDRSISQEEDLRKEHSSQSKGYVDMKSAYSKVLSAYDGAQAGNPDSQAQNDLSLLFGFVRMQHPDALVREGQIQTAEEARGVAGDAIQLYQKIAKNGEPLTPQQRKGFLGAANQIFGSEGPNQKQRDSFYSDVAKRRGVDPRNVVAPMDLTSESQALEDKYLKPPASNKGAPKVGEIQKGYRFLGGNPAAQSSWVKK